MQIRISALDVAATLAEHRVNLTHIPPRHRPIVLKIETFNMVARGFCLSTILLVAGAVSLFFSTATALVYFGSGVLLRKITETELDKYFSPGGVASAVAYAIHLVNSEEKDRILFATLNIPQPEDWGAKKWYLNICNTEFWQSTISIA